MNFSKLFLTLTLAVILSACGSVKDRYTKFISGDGVGAIKVDPLVDITPTVEIKKLWSTQVGDGTDGYYLRLTPVAGEGGNIIYAIDRDGDVVALEVTTGKRHWRSKTKKRLSGGPGYGEGKVLVGTRDGEVLGLSSEDGELLWTAQVSSEVLSTPKIDLGVVVVRTVDGKAYGLDASNGQRLWVYERAVPLLTLRGTSSPQLAEGLAIIGFDGGLLAALDITNGSLVWERRIALPSGRSTLDRMVDIDGEPVIMDGAIHVATFQGSVAIVELGTGKMAWIRELSSYAGLSVDTDHVYLSDELSEVWALERYSGNSVWKQEQLVHRKLTAPVSIGDFVVVGDYEGYLHWLDRYDGSLRGRVRVDRSEIITTPFVIGDVLYAYSSDGELAAYQAE